MALAAAAPPSPYPAGPDVELDQALEAARLLLDASPAHRRDATAFDPLLWAVLYFPHHLLAPLDATVADRLDDDLLAIDDELDQALAVITLAGWHLDLCTYALTNWTRPAGVREQRDLFAAPRDSGKSTWLYLILPLWAGAHGHKHFIAAFADAAAQAEEHLGTMRLELETNELLREDFPDLVEPRYRRGRRTVSDRVDALHQANGFRIVARGIDRATLGLKKGADRPDLILLDDLEPDEARYSERLARKRRRTLLEAVLPMNLRASVIYTGTVVMYGSIVHQALRWARDELPPEERDDARWVAEERFTIHHVLPIEDLPDGTRRSYWPARYPLAELEAMEGTRSYRKNYLNLPLPGEGNYWTDELYRYGELDAYGATVLYIDPAVTTGAGADWTGLAVISRAPADADERAIYVRHTSRLKAVGKRLRNRVEAVLAAHPDVRRIVVETNQGGDYLIEALADLGPPVVSHHEHLAKDVRAERVLDYYERRPARIVHAGAQPLLEAEQCGFPDASTRDVLDAANGGILYLLRRHKTRGKTASRSYL